MIIGQPDITIEVHGNQLSQPEIQDWGNTDDIFKYWDRPSNSGPGTIDVSYEYQQPDNTWISQASTNMSVVRKNKIKYLARINGQTDRTTTTAEKCVNIVDTTPPVITLQPSIVKIDVGKDPPETYTENGWIVTDNYSQPENITVTVDNFRINQPSDLTQPEVGQPVGEISKASGIGSYKIKYVATDENNNVSIPVYRLLELEDNVAPVITINGQQTTNLEVYSAYNDLGARVYDNYYGQVIDRNQK